MRFLENLHEQTEDLCARLRGPSSDVAPAATEEHTEECDSDEGSAADEETGDEATQITEDWTNGMFNLKIVKNVDGDSFKLEYVPCDGDDGRNEIVHGVRLCDWGTSPVVMMNLKPDSGRKDDRNVTEKELKQRVEKHIASKNWKGLNTMMENVNRSIYPMGDIVFGKLGEQVEVMKPLKTRVLLMLSGRETTSFKFLPLKNPKYTLKITPSEGTLSYHGTRAVIVKIKLLMQCTTTVVLDLPVVFCRGSKSDQERLLRNKDFDNSKLCKCVLMSQLQGRVSTYLDLDELVIFSPPLSEGQFSRVFRGKYRGIDVACKRLDNAQYMNPITFSTIRREVGMFEALRHPCIVNFIGATLVDGAYTITTELCEYGSLTSAMKKHSDVWTMPMKVKALYDCARAMDFLHRSSIIHRDLKPGNLLVVSLDINSPVVCKLSDFGTTKGTNVMVQNMAQTKKQGTQSYMAPEIMEGKDDYTNKVDVYSFGIMIASVVDDCKPPYHGIPEEPYRNVPKAKDERNFHLHLKDGMRPTVSKIGEMPVTLKTLMEHSWDYDPIQRPSFERILLRLTSCLETLKTTSHERSKSEQPALLRTLTETSVSVTNRESPRTPPTLPHSVSSTGPLGSSPAKPVNNNQRPTRRAPPG